MLMEIQNVKVERQCKKRRKNRKTVIKEEEKGHKQDKKNELEKKKG